MLSFIRGAVIMESLHSNTNPKREGTTVIVLKEAIRQPQSELGKEEEQESQPS